MARPRRDAGAPAMDRRILGEFDAMAREMPTSEITVAALCRRAGCNKTTFYYHFATFADLVERYLEKVGTEELAAQAVGELLGCEERGAVRDSTPELAERYDLLCTLAALNPQGIMAEHIRAALRRHAALALGVGEQPSPRQEMLVEFATGGFAALLAFRGRAGNSIGFDETVAAFYPDIIPALVRAAREARGEGEGQANR